MGLNADVFKGKWKEVKGKAKAKWGSLTDDELDQIEGNREQLIGKLQQKYGWEKDKAQKEVDNFSEQYLQ